MTIIKSVDLSKQVFHIHRDQSITAVDQTDEHDEAGQDGFTLGVVTMTEDAPHGGEMHPDGDEIILVISGRLAVSCDDEPGVRQELRTGDACIIPRGQWHRVHILEPTTLMYMTSGPNNEHRPLHAGGS